MLDTLLRNFDPRQRTLIRSSLQPQRVFAVGPTIAEAWERFDRNLHDETQMVGELFCHFCDGEVSERSGEFEHDPRCVYVALKDAIERRA